MPKNEFEDKGPLWPTNELYEAVIQNAAQRLTVPVWAISLDDAKEICAVMYENRGWEVVSITKVRTS